MSDSLRAGGLVSDDPTTGVVRVLLGATEHPIIQVDPTTGRVDYKRPAGASGAHTFDGTLVVKGNGNFLLVEDAGGGAGSGANVRMTGNGLHADVYCLTGVLHLRTLSTSPIILSPNNVPMLTVSTIGISSAGGIGAFGASPPVVKPTITGSRSGATASVVAQMLAAFATAGWWTDGTSA